MRIRIALIRVFDQCSYFAFVPKMPKREPTVSGSTSTSSAQPVISQTRRRCPPSGRNHPPAISRRSECLAHSFAASTSLAFVAESKSKLALIGISPKSRDFLKQRIRQNRFVFFAHDVALRIVGDVRFLAAHNLTCRAHASRAASLLGIKRGHRALSCRGAPHHSSSPLSSSSSSSGSGCSGCGGIGTGIGGGVGCGCSRCDMVFLAGWSSQNSITPVLRTPPPCSHNARQALPATRPSRTLV